MEFRGQSHADHHVLFKCRKISPILSFFNADPGAVDGFAVATSRQVASDPTINFGIRSGTDVLLYLTHLHYTHRSAHVSVDRRVSLANHDLYRLCRRSLHYTQGQFWTNPYTSLSVLDVCHFVVVSALPQMAPF